VLISPLFNIDADFTNFRLRIRSKYKFNGLKHSLEWMLNDAYDPILRRIYIVPIAKMPTLFFKMASEQPDAYWRTAAEIPDYWFLPAEQFNQQIATDYEFTIYVHASTPFNVAELLAMVQQYRMYGLRPRVVRFGIGPEIEAASDYFL